MNTDSTFAIGNDHIVCEDYALSEVSAGMAYAVVSDGCSASPEVDFGARCMAMSAKRALRLGCQVDNPVRFGEIVVQNAARVIDVFPYLSPQCLDATLLVAWVQDNKLTAYLYGDGVLVHKSNTSITTVHISLTSGAPDYLSYQLDPIRRQYYEKVEDNQKNITVTIAGKSIVTKGTPLIPYVMSNVPVEKGDIIAVISDGINSFRKADSTPISYQELVDEFTGYKTLNGEFALRRIAAFKRKCLKEGTTHSDDISIAAIVV